MSFRFEFVAPVEGLGLLSTCFGHQYVLSLIGETSCLFVSPTTSSVVSWSFHPLCSSHVCRAYHFNLSKMHATPSIDVKNVDPKNKKNFKNAFFYEKIKNVKTLNKKRCWQINNITQTKWKKFPSKIRPCCLNMHDNAWGQQLFMREFL